MPVTEWFRGPLRDPARELLLGSDSISGPTSIARRFDSIWPSMQKGSRIATRRSGLCSRWRHSCASSSDRTGNADLSHHSAPEPGSLSQSWFGSPARQHAITSKIEIIVVDNGSARLPSTVCSAWADVRLVSESIPGPGPARNRGIREARGDILAFIDADCRADPGWLAAIEAAFANRRTRIIAGDVQVSYENPSQPTFLEPYESIYSYRNSEHIAEGFSGTGNLAMLPSVVAEIGSFAGIEVAEDRDWGLRACAAGYAIRYVPEMIVFHPARKTFAELTGKWDRHIGYDYKRIRPRRLGALRWLVRADIALLAPCLGSAGAHLGISLSDRNQALSRWSHDRSAAPGRRPKNFGRVESEIEIEDGRTAPRSDNCYLPSGAHALSPRPIHPRSDPFPVCLRGSPHPGRQASVDRISRRFYAGSSLTQELRSVRVRS
jgi:GT2 family glycosyltransferase